MFVSVEQGDITFYWVSVFEKVYLGITTATKTCYQKKEKWNQELKRSKNVGIFFNYHHFSFFLSSRGFLLRLYLRGGRGVAPYQFQCLDFFDFLRFGRHPVAKCRECWKKPNFLLKINPGTPPLASYILIKSGRYFLSIWLKLLFGFRVNLETQLYLSKTVYRNSWLKYCAWIV